MQLSVKIPSWVNTSFMGSRVLDLLVIYCCRVDASECGTDVSKENPSNAAKAYDVKGIL